MKSSASGSQATALRTRRWLLSALVCLLSLGVAAGCGNGGGQASSGFSGGGNSTGGTATTLAFTVQPSRVNSGSAVTPGVQVTLLDANNNAVLGSTSAVTIALGNKPSAGTLTGTVTANAVNGVATFSDLAIDVGGQGYTLTASSPGLAQVTSNPFNVIRKLSFGTPTMFPETGSADPQTVATGDFNHDGKRDWVMLNSANNRVHVYFGNGDGTFGAPVTVNIGAGAHSVAVADFNGDGADDIVTAGTANVSVVESLGNGTFNAAQNIAVGAGLRGVCTADFNGSGRQDILVFDANDQSIYLLSNNGAFAFVAHNFASGGKIVNGRTPVAADFNGDGAPDLAIADFGANKATVWMNGKTGNAATLFNSAANIDNSLTYAANGNAQGILAVDLNGDNRPDIAVPDDFPHAGGAQMPVFLNNGNGTFGAPVIYPSGRDGFGSVAADFNLDGNLDIAIATLLGTQGVGEADIFLGNGDGTLQALQAFQPGEGLRSIAVGDFNGDGLPDMVVAGDNAFVYLNTSK